MLLREYEADVRTRSAKAATDSNWRYWLFYHERWYGDEEPPLPITVDKIKAVVSQLKQQGHRSISNFVFAAKDKQLDAQWQWAES